MPHWSVSTLTSAILVFGAANIPQQTSAAGFCKPTMATEDVSCPDGSTQQYVKVTNQCECRANVTIKWGGNAAFVTVRPNGGTEKTMVQTCGGKKITQVDSSYQWDCKKDNGGTHKHQGSAPTIKQAQEGLYPPRPSCGNCLMGGIWDSLKSEHLSPSEFRRRMDPARIDARMDTLLRFAKEKNAAADARRNAAAATPQGPSCHQRWLRSCLAGEQESCQPPARFVQAMQNAGEDPYASCCSQAQDNCN
jgi:hypothetical protein